MTRIRTPGRLAAVCALVALSGLGLGCDLNPQPLPPGGSGFSGGMPGVVGTTDASASYDDGGGGGFNLGGGDASLALPGRDSGKDATAPDATPGPDASDGAPEDAAEAGEAAADCLTDGEGGPGEGEQ